jgi:hypothetical protein
MKFRVGNDSLIVLCGITTSSDYRVVMSYNGTDRYFT